MMTIAELHPTPTDRTVAGECADCGCTAADTGAPVAYAVFPTGEELPVCRYCLADWVPSRCTDPAAHGALCDCAYGQCA